MGLFSFVPMLMAAVLTGGTGNHLLDYASTPAYWQIKKVDVTLDNMLAELKVVQSEDLGELLKGLLSNDPVKRQEAQKALLAKGPAALPQLRELAADPDPELAATAKALVDQISLSAKASSVRRLMAIRTLGEMKKPEALPVLRPLLQSQEMFVAEYAARAIASIENKPYAAAGLPAEQRKIEYGLFPANTVVLAQHASFGRHPFTLDAILPHLLADAKVDKTRVGRVITASVLQIAEQVGDMRLDCVTLGIPDNIGPNSGWVVMVFRGEYDAAAGVALLRKAGVASDAVAGMDVFKIDREVGVICPGNNRVIFMAGPTQEALPIQPMIAAIRADKGTLAESQDMMKLIGAVDVDAPAWGVAKCPAVLRMAAMFSAFDTATATVKLDGDNATLALKATGADAQQVKAAVEQASRLLDNIRNVAAGDAQRDPAMKPIADVLASVKITDSGKTGQLTAAGRLDLPLIGAFVGGVSSSDLRRMQAMEQAK